MLQVWPKYLVAENLDQVEVFYIEHTPTQHGQRENERLSPCAFNSDT